MSSLQEYNKLISELILKGYEKMLEHDNEIIRGGGAFSAQQKPLPIVGNQEPFCGIDPKNNFNGKEEGGKLKIIKTTGAIMGNTAHTVTKGMGHVANETGKVIAPVAKKAGEKIATKVVDHVADKAINSLINSMDGDNTNQIKEGEGLKKRGRPKTGGKMNFIKSLEKVGSKVVDKVGNVVVNKGIDKAVKYMTSPEGEQVAEEVAEAGAESGAGIKKPRKKRGPSRRNMLIGKLMKEHKMTMKEANEYLKKNNIR
jgi:hypothetical protein